MFAFSLINNQTIDNQHSLNQRLQTKVHWFFKPFLRTNEAWSDENCSFDGREGDKAYLIQDPVAPGLILCILIFLEEK